MNSEKNYRKYYRPFENIKPNPNDQDPTGFFRGGILSFALNKSTVYFFFIAIIWWFVLYSFGIEVNVSLFAVAHIDLKKIAIYTVFSGIFGTVLHIVLSSLITSTYLIYREQWAWLEDVLCDMKNNRHCICDHLNWNKILKKSSLVIDKKVTTLKHIKDITGNYVYNLDYSEYGESENEAFILLKSLRDYIYITSFDGYKLEHHLRGDLRLRNLPIPPETKEKIITKNDDNSHKHFVTDEHKLDLIHIEKRDILYWFVEYGYLKEHYVDEVLNREAGENKTVKKIQRSKKVLLPKIIGQCITIGFGFLYTMLIPILWETYGLILGAIAGAVVIVIHNSMINGISAQKNITDDPRYNPTIQGYTVSDACHDYAKNSLDFWNIHLKNIGLTLDDEHDENSNIIKINKK